MSSSPAKLFNLSVVTLRGSALCSAEVIQHQLNNLAIKANQPNHKKEVINLNSYKIYYYEFVLMIQCKYFIYFSYELYKTCSVLISRPRTPSTSLELTFLVTAVPLYRVMLFILAGNLLTVSTHVTKFCIY